MAFILLLTALFSNVFFCNGQVEYAGCSDNFIFHTDVTLWSSASDYCKINYGFYQGQGTDLSVILSNDTNNEIIETAIALGITIPLWIGLSDPDDGIDFNYQWVDGQFLSDTGYNTWAINPLNDTNNNCVYIDPLTGTWFKDDCQNANHGVICRK